MVNDEILRKLFKAFPYAIINRKLEFIAEPNPKVNSYFILSGAGTEQQVQCKLLEWLSREASSSLHYKNGVYNDKVHKYHRDGINSFLDTNFTHEDMELIYSKLGNGVNRELTIKFIQSGFNMEILNAENLKERNAMNENVKKWAEKLDGREYGNGLTSDEITELEALGLVVVFGASDDLCEFNGAIDDEVGCFDGGDIYVNAEGLIANNMDMSDNFLPENSPDYVHIKACWDCDGYSWAYETDIPHESFEIFDDGDPYCRGIVFSIADMPKGECVK